MNMTPAEIVADYRQSKTPMKQIGILADLNVCTRQEIVDILREAGEELPKNYQKKPKAEPKTEVKTTGTFTIEIAAGSSSDTVCKLLERGGAISSAADFDAYLCSHGYDHKIRTGKHTIPAGSDYETIAKIITVKQ